MMEMYNSRISFQHRIYSLSLLFPQITLNIRMLRIIFLLKNRLLLILFRNNITPNKPLSLSPTSTPCPIIIKEATRRRSNSLNTINKHIWSNDFTEASNRYKNGQEGQLNCL